MQNMYKSDAKKLQITNRLFHSHFAETLFSVETKNTLSFMAAFNTEDENQAQARATLVGQLASPISHHFSKYCKVPKRC